MLKSTPYRFALVSHLVFDEYARSSFMSDGEFTLDYFDISYEQPLFGIPNLIEQGYEAVLLYSSFGPNFFNEIGQFVALIAKTDTDVIKTLLRARETSREVLLPVHDNESVDVVFLEKLLDMRIHAVHYRDMSTLREKLQALFEQGYNVLLGGGVSEAMAVSYGASFFRVMPNMRSIKQAIDQAKGLARARREERNSKEQLVSVLRVFREGVVCVDEEGSLVFFNNKAVELLNIHKTRNKEERVKGYCQQLMIFDVLYDETPREDIVLSIGGGQFVVTTLPVSLYAGMHGAVAFISDVNTIRTRSGRLRESRRLSGFVARHTVEDFQGTLPSVQRLKSMVRLYAPHDAAVLIHGETGTGKEVLAQALHNTGPRRDEPFVAINCAALPDSLLESELFGYEEGAFTGAQKGGKPGVFEMAHKGTLFLDEIGDMGADAQLRLLRVLETRELIRIGGNRIIPVDIRIVSASHRSLAALVHGGSFRRDLFYRLAVLRLHIPPLRHRVKDIPLLLEDVLHCYDADIRNVSPAMLHSMEDYAWPGNVRELLAFMESYLILLGGRRKDELLFMELLHDWTYDGLQADAAAPRQPDAPAKAGMKGLTKETRRRIALDAVRECGGNKSHAAARLGISYNTLWRILSERA